MSNKNPGGRPLKFKTNKELQEKIDAYFIFCDEFNKPYTVSGLADFLDTDRITLIRYENRDAFSNTIKKAKQKIEAQFEERALFGKYNPAIAIFLMKNNFGYTDKTEVKLESYEDDPISKALKGLVNDKS